MSMPVTTDTLAFQYVGRVQPSTEPHFDDCHINCCRGEQGERKGCRDLEVGDCRVALCLKADDEPCDVCHRVREVSRDQF